MPDIGQICKLVRDYLSVDEYRLTDDSIINVHNLQAIEMVQGKEFYWAERIYERKVTSGTWRVEYPPDFRSVVKAGLYTSASESPLYEMKVVVVQEASRIGQPIKSGYPDVLLCDRDGFQVQNIPESELWIRITYQAKPEELTGAKGHNILTDHASSALTHFLTYKCAAIAAGMMSESQWHQQQYKEALALLEDEHAMRVLADFEVVGRPDGRSPGYSREGGRML